MFSSILKNVNSGPGFSGEFCKTGKTDRVIPGFGPVWEVWRVCPDPYHGWVTSNAPCPRTTIPRVPPPLYHHCRNIPGSVSPLSAVLSAAIAGPSGFFPIQSMVKDRCPRGYQQWSQWCVPDREKCQFVASSDTGFSKTEKSSKFTVFRVFTKKSGFIPPFSRFIPGPGRLNPSVSVNTRVLPEIPLFTGNRR